MMYSIIAFVIVWIAVSFSAFLIYRQKMGPHYETLPALRRRHENLGFLWVVLLLINLALKPSVFGFLIPSSVLVVWTGINLKNNKPTAVFVHVGFVMITAVIALLTAALSVISF